MILTDDTQLTVFVIPWTGFGNFSACQTGVYNMAVDEAVLDWVRGKTQYILVLRVYCWNTPTLSLGVNQAKSDTQLQKLLTQFKQHNHQLFHWVRRPTGGRAIIHGDDISFSFVSNHPKLQSLTLEQSYQVLNGWVKQALINCGVSLQTTEEKLSSSSYVGNPWCFQSHTLMDIMDNAGQKIGGAAQLRRHNGLLQHGALFLKKYNVSASGFRQALVKTVQKALPAATVLNLMPESDKQNAVAEQNIQPAVTDAGLNALITEKMAIYLKALSGSFASSSVNAGSHFVPASDCSTLTVS